MPAGRALLVLFLAASSIVAMCASKAAAQGSQSEIPTIPVAPLPVAPSPLPPPVSTPRLPLFTPVSTPLPPAVILPTDLTHTYIDTDAISGKSGGNLALRGICRIGDTELPDSGSMSLGYDRILVHAQGHSDFEQESPYFVRLYAGVLLGSVRRPSNMGIISTPFGDIALSANSSVLIKYNRGELRIFSLLGNRLSIKIVLDKGPFQGSSRIAMALAPGYELVASTDKLLRSQVRPSDGIARRHSKVLEPGNAAVSEFSAQSALQSSEIILSLGQRSSTASEKRILADMSKMAAVLNYVNGTQGFTATASGQN